MAVLGFLWALLPMSRSVVCRILAVVASAAAMDVAFDVFGTLLDPPPMQTIPASWRYTGAQDGEGEIIIAGGDQPFERESYYGT